MQSFFYYKASIPAFPSQFDIPLDGPQPVVLPQGSNLAVDVTFYDRYDNMITTELSEGMFNDIRMYFVYMNRT